MSSKKTKYLNMHDWIGTDPWRRSEISENFQKLDDKALKLDDSMAAATTTAGQAKTTAEGINAKAESALTNSTSAVTNANAAVQTASAADAKATTAKTTAEDALTKAQSADATATSVQNQFDQVVINGDSSIEAAQARVDTNGQTYTTLKQRLDSEHQSTTSLLAEKAKQSDLEVERARISNLTANAGNTDGNAELLDIRVTAAGTTKTTAGEAVRSQIGQVKTDMVEQFAKVKKGKNLYDPSKNQSGIASSKAIGSLQTTEASTLVWQKIRISNANDYTLTGFRVHSITDINNIVVKQLVYTDVQDANAVTLLKANIPATAYYLWVSTYTANTTSNAQIEIGQQRTTYEPFNDFMGLESNGKALPIITESEINDATIAPQKTWSSQKISTEFSSDFYDSGADSKKVEELTDKLTILSRNMESMYNARKGGTYTSQNINLKNTNSQKMLLHLHKRENNGYDTVNDVYLPDAENDFSDVRIKTDEGEILPYHVVYKGNLDIIPDKRLGMNHIGLVFTDSNKNMITTINGYVSRSLDNGVTWTALNGLSGISSPTVVNVIDDAIFFSKNGVMYRSEAPYSTYTQVLDISVGYTQTHLLSTSMVEHPDGELFIGSYQLEWAIRIYKSVDRGVTWELIFSSNTYQHIHNMTIDVHSTPIAIYAGADGGGGVYKSTNKGATWSDLRALNPSMPQSSDYGIIYSSEAGHRLLGGETSIMGGYSIIKTTDDATFNPVLAAGNGVYMIQEINGKLIAGGISNNSFKNAVIFISEDDGETWRQAYTTQPLVAGGASDGFRFIAKDVYASTTYEQLIVGCQSQKISPLRIVSDEKSYYAEIIVDIPQGCTGITVESGYVSSSETLIYNDFEVSNTKILSLGLNEGGKYVKESVSGKIIEGNFNYHDVGKHLSYNYPYITSAKDRQSMKLSSLGNGINVNVSLSSVFTISFWGRFGYATRFNILAKPNDTGDNFLQFDNHELRGGGIRISTLRFPVVPDAFSKYDLVVDTVNGTITTYENARKIAVSTTNIVTLLANIKGLTSVDLLKVLNSNENDAIQNFTIYSGAVSESEIYNSYNSFISDNHH